MKKIITSSLLAVVAVACFAQNKVGDIIKSGDNYFMYLAEFKTPEANEEFQQNLAVIQTQNAQIKQLKDQIKASNKEEQKLYMEATLKKLEANYKENEKIMAKAYKFAPNRTYKQVYFKSNLCIILSKDEIAQLRMNDNTLIDPQKMANKRNFSMYRVKEINGSQENEQLQIQLTDLMNKQLEINKLRKQLAETKDAVAQKSINEKISVAEKAIKDIDGKLRAKYTIPQGRDYAVEIANSRLYLLLTPEEIKQIQQHIEKAKSNKK
ncbi:MAG: hypothetical protein E7035_01315 [Verrucomicrobiaceae bacterium]|nr:hypothetical protein [Verrucomicrobiaceae bacterium]